MSYNLFQRTPPFFKKKKIVNFIRVKSLRFIQKTRIVYYLLLSNNSQTISSAVLNQPALVLGKGKITMGSCNIGVWPSPYFLSTYAHIEARNESSNITIGNGTWINNNAVIIADKKDITIGEQVLIGTNLFLTDSDFHSLEFDKRSEDQYSVSSVKISDNVFIGSNVTILKGVTIGVNSVIANGSIVASDIPKNVIAGGVPAKVIRPLQHQETELNHML